MAVATPVIERRISQLTSERENNAGMNADELHNARMGNNLARLLNPEYKIKDVVASIDADGSQIVQQVAPVQTVAESAPVQTYQADGIIARRAPAQPVYTVTGARADADIFRADSPVNRQVQAYAPAQAYAAAPAIAAPVSAPAEEENEDLRPTPTTIQYQTIGADGTAIVGRARTMQECEITRPEENEHSSKLTFSKRDKIIMGVILSLILAVFVLIIVNSAIISGLNAEIAVLEDRGAEIASQYGAVAGELEELTSYDNVYNVAVEQGWILAD